MGYLHLLIVVSLYISLSSTAMETNESRQLQNVIITKRVMKTITVDASSGQGQFTSVQAAINSVPDANPSWICIRIMPGVYREKLTIEKPYLILKGVAGKRRTKIVWDDHQSLQLSATLNVVVDNFVAKGISFINSYNLPEYGGDKRPRVPAAAAYINGDKCTFISCGFFGVQDTLWDVQGRHYFYRTTIVGSVDFILGSGQSLYEECDLFVLGGVLDAGTAGFITSQSRSSPNESNGFVFKGGSIIGEGLAYLGRPWGPYARVLFYNTTMSDIVVPQGWDAWNSAGEEYKVTFAEAECKGPGANRAGRVPWEKKMSFEEIEKFASLDYINSDKWLDAQPVNIHSI
ncbi:unnamed protein product [Rhodiola kirilowii]